MQITKPKLNYLSIVVMLNLGSSNLALATTVDKDAEAKKSVETITVTGIRGSLMRAQDLKQSSDSIVDGIMAEDIGKFPDQNVAESLQRISGVAIDREGGEGQLISVRGLGPEFNSVLVNGRTMATISGGRAFSFDTLASELINGAQVFKTQTAKLQEGSIGATVNITTHKPLDIDGYKAVASVKATYDKMAKQTNPTFSGLISNIFDDGKLGVLASLSFSDRDSRSDTGQTFGYIKRDLNLADGTQHQDVYMPRNYDQIVQTENRKRTSGTVVVQYQPSSELLMTADMLYSKYDISYRQDILAHWFDNANIVDATLDKNNTIVQLNSARNSATDYLNRLSYRPTTTTAFGFNIDWAARDDLTVIADISLSKAKSLNGGRTTDTVAGFVNAYSYDNSTGSLMPQLKFAEDLDSSRVGSNWASKFGDDINDEILDVKLGAEWVLDAGALTKVSFGVQHTDRKLATTYSETNWRVSVLHGGYPKGVDIPDSLFTVLDADGFLSAAGGNTANQWLVFDSYQFMDFLLTDTAINGLADPQAARDTIAKYNGFEVHASPDAYKINEVVTALYVDTQFEGDISDMPWQVTAGLRYVKTNNTATGATIKLLDLVDTNNTGDYQAVKSEQHQAVEIKHSYNHLLPSLNANIELVDDVFARFAYSKSLTRPTLTKMSPSTSYGGGKLDSLTASGGNPLLDPYESTNFDLSLEWYYEEASYVSSAYFTKDIDNFIDTGVSKEKVSLKSGNYDYMVSRPMNINSTKITGVEIAFQHSFTQLPAPFDGLGLMANMTFVDSKSATDTVEKPLPLPGLGDSQNLVMFYEKDNISFRIAYNNRDSFMQKTTNGYGGAPIYVDDYSQIDASGSYDISDDLTLFIEGINLTNEITRKHGLYDNHVLAITENGPRYSVGLRMTF